MIKSNRIKTVLAVAVLVITGFTSNGVAKDKPLKIFILAGQSNMVGHARGHTMATLFNNDGPKDKVQPSWLGMRKGPRGWRPFSIQL